jgi:hypothetical protein
MSPDFPRLRAEEARCLAQYGRKAEAAAILRELEDLRQTDYVDGYPMACVYDALGRREEALNALERAAEENSPHLFMMDVDPRMGSLRSHPRFTRLRNRIFRSMPVERTPRDGKGSVVVATYTAKDSTHTHRAAS